MATRRGGRFRSKLCRNFALGHCPQGDKCNYIHATPESIQNNTHTLSSPPIQPTISQRSIDDPLSASAFSPSLWPTLSPATNASSDHPAYHWGTSNTTHSGPASESHIKYRPLSWRTTLCRHFLKNRGWCPLGDDCNYIHDLTLAEFAKDDVRFASRRNPASAANGKPERSKVGSKHSHCWAYVQGLCHVADCQYLHPAAVQMFAAHTPCLAWPNCRRGPLCPYKHPEPYISQSPPTSPTVPGPPPHHQMVPSLPTAPALPTAQQFTADAVPRGVGAVPYSGMFYFPIPPHQQQFAAPSQLPSAPHLQHPQHLPVRSQQAVVFTNPWDSIPSSSWPFPGSSYGSPPTSGNSGNTMVYTPVTLGPPGWFGDSHCQAQAQVGQFAPQAVNAQMQMQMQMPLQQTGYPQHVLLSPPYALGYPPPHYHEDAVPRQLQTSLMFSPSMNPSGAGNAYGASALNMLPDRPPSTEEPSGVPAPQPLRPSFAFSTTTTLKTAATAESTQASVPKARAFSTPADESDLPYVPSRPRAGQGHARRISVSTQAQTQTQTQARTLNRDAMDALGLDSSSSSSSAKYSGGNGADIGRMLSPSGSGSGGGRLPWQTHSADRLARRVSVHF
ncbi:hypothetical protein C8Q80DRAFT_680039 [Daedaleopsis nitida]|nr:hypothetical protein C8Q80DRAFT_680039 [Daedaleopsis nitida]